MIARTPFLYLFPSCYLINHTAVGFTTITAITNAKQYHRLKYIVPADTKSLVQAQSSSVVEDTITSQEYEFDNDYNQNYDYYQKQAQDYYLSYSSQSLKRKYDQSGGILYRQSILNKDEIDTLQKELLSQNQNHNGPIKLIDETTSSVAINRIGAQLSLDSNTVRILGDEKGSISRLVNSIANNDEEDDESGGGRKRMILSPDVPVEIRVYEKKGAGMEWHVDDVLFDPPQIEVVLTIENTSDCITIWEEEQNKNTCGNEGINLKQVETKPNSAIFLKAGGVRHRVSSLKYGRRTIVKFVYIREDAKMIDGAEVHLKQFGIAGGKMKSKGQKKRKKKTSR